MTPSALRALLGFAAGQAPLDVPWSPAEGCADCHTEEHAAWQGSRHAAAWQNPLFQEGYAVEPADNCVHCHAPLAPQGPEARDEGVTCVVCHLRGGAVLATSVSGEAPHPSRAEPALSASVFCAGCHEFTFPIYTEEGTVWTAELMQSTYQEWQAARDSRRCQDCHMPDGAHTFHGAHDTTLLREAVSVSVETDGRRLIFTLASHGVAHAFPTGDLFRHVRLEVQRPGQPWEEVYRLQQQYVARWDPQLSAHVRQLHIDSRLHPGEPVSVAVPAQPLRWRLRYHYTAADGPAVELHSGDVSP